MTNLLTLIVLGLTGLAVIFGLLLGFIRGANRSILRFIIVIACFIGAIIFKDKVIDIVLSYSFNGKTIEATIEGLIPEDFSDYIDMIKPLIRIIVGVITYLLLFIGLQIISMIVFWIFKLFVRPGDRKKSLLGGIVGILQGAAVAFALCFAITGLSVEMEKLAEVEMDGEKLIDLSSVSVSGKTIDFKDYNESKVGQIYIKLGSKLFNKITTYTEGEKTYTLSGQIDTIIYGIKMANEMKNIAEVNFDGGLNSENMTEVKSLLKNLDDMKKDMSEETKETITNLISEVADDFELPIDVSNFDLEKISFENEGNILEEVYNYQESGEIENVDDLVSSLASSELILPLASSTGVVIDLNPVEKLSVENAINNLSDVDTETLNNLKVMFGITTSD